MPLPEDFDFKTAECRTLARMLDHYAVRKNGDGHPDCSTEMFGAVQQLDSLLHRLTERVEALEQRDRDRFADNIMATYDAAMKARREGGDN